MSHSPTPPAPLSWDSERGTTPERPPHVAGFKPAELITRPRRTTIALVLVVLAAVTTLTITALAATHVVALRETLTSIIPDDLNEEYSEATIQRAINIVLGTVGGLGLLLTLIQVLSALQVWRRKSGARPALTIAVVLSLPVAFVSASLRNAATTDMVATLLSLIALCAAVVLVLTPRVATWLRQDETPRKQKLLTPATSEQV